VGEDRVAQPHDRNQRPKPFGSLYLADVTTAFGDVRNVGLAQLPGDRWIGNCARLQLGKGSHRQRGDAGM
jgi:hypothetical protein